MFASDIPLLLLRLALGVFFAISGWHKLFNPGRHASLVSTLAADHVPFVRVNQWFVPTVELSAGASMTVGLLTPLAAVGLLGICSVACLVDGLRRIPAMAPIDRADWLDDLLYLPEVVMALCFVQFAVVGGGPYSVDALLWR